MLRAMAPASFPRDFNLDKLLAFARTYEPDARFHAWVDSAPQAILHALRPDVLERYVSKMRAAGEF